MDNITKKSCDCGCQVFIKFGGRVEPSDVYIFVGDHQVPVGDFVEGEEEEGDTEESEDPEEKVVFPQIVVDLGIEDRVYNSGCVEFDFTICSECRRIQ